MSSSLLKGRKGLHLALGGGAARGLAHLGILRAFKKHQIPVASICGTSMGALIGACYALHPDADQVTHDIREYINSDHFNRARYAFIRKVYRDINGKRSLRQRLSHGYLLGRSFATGAIVPFEEYQAEIFSLVPDKTFRDTRIPFFAVSVDLVHSREVVFNLGCLRPALMASCAIPGVFPAVASGDCIYVDGGWMNKIPVNPLLGFGAQNVLAIDVSDDPVVEINPRRGYSLLAQTHRSAQIRLLEFQLERASLVWRPPVTTLHWADFSQIDQAVELGFQFAEDHMDEIKRLLKPAPRRRWWSRMAPSRQELIPRFPFQQGYEVRGIWKASLADTQFQKFS